MFQKVKIFTVVAVLGFLLLGLQATAAEVPHLINFQSVLTDPAGNPLPDGVYDVSFRLQDETGGEMYSETQSLELIGGVASAMVGSRGDLNTQILSPDLPLFLSVQVAGNGPAQVMEVVSVPYALYSEKALTVAPLSIGTESISLKAITRDLLSDELLASLAQDWTKDIEVNHTHVDGKISNLDTRLTTEETNRVASVAQESSARQTADNNLQSQINERVTVTNFAASVSAMVSATTSETNARVTTLEEDVTQLQNPPQYMRPFAFGEIGPGPTCAVLSGYNIASAEFDGGDHCRVVFSNAAPNTNYTVLVTREGSNSHASTGTVYHDKTTTGVWVSTGDVSKKMSVIVFANF